jgi:predicted  nucleic acid-binding Zn-ribbon protein
MDKLNLSGARALASRLRALPGEMDHLRDRIARLEEELRESRRHQQRLAELTDVVQELLLPISQRDQAGIDEVLARYADHLA